MPSPSLKGEQGDLMVVVLLELPGSGCPSWGAARPRRLPQAHLQLFAVRTVLKQHCGGEEAHQICFKW